MSTLPAGHMEVTLVLVPRGYREAFGGAEGTVLDARHVVITGQLQRGHIQ